MGAVTKSGLMVGLGEEKSNILQAFADLRRKGCDLLTMGQYLQPTKANVRVNKYYTPLEFNQLEMIARDFGFKDVVAGPLVRSSYMAHKMFKAVTRTE
jgi:lipoic acid synthetase